jgi:predicted flap endonuclease-1-like 5' DNA nuclease
VKVETIEGIGEIEGERLRTAGIATVGELLDKGSGRGGRAALAMIVQVPEATILDWVNVADLMRVTGIGPESAELLVAAGVDSPAELARRNPDHLAAALAAIAPQRGPGRRAPGERELVGWIDQARTLPHIVEH